MNRNHSAPIISLFSLFLLTICQGNPFEQIGTRLPAPSESRLASGAPGPAYWQQEANYLIDVELDESTSRIIGNETIEYVNHSPHTLHYLWVQLDQNALAQGSKRQRSDQGPDFEGEPGEPAEVEFYPFRRFVENQKFEGGYLLKSVADTKDKALPYTVVNTNMRIDLPTPLRSGESVSFKISWEFAIQDEALSFRHGKKELENGDYAYQLSQWFPRMCGYYDGEGWQVKPYVGSGEFALEFGNYEVSITAPEDFIVAATGELANANRVLSSVQRERLESAKGASEPVFIVTPEEASENLEEKSADKKTWIYKAENVRDFAFAASRGYIWDAKSVDIDGQTVMAMSVYPPEAAPLWQRFSTESVIQAVNVYSRVVYPYPYPVMWSAWGPTGGMEYPMMTFQSSWDIDDKDTYPEEHRDYVIRVVIHEVGHNWFPMIINSDERQWMWLDEGLNTFVENLASTEFDPVMQRNYTEGRRRTIDTMVLENDPIIMTAADDLTRRGYQAYTKPALGLVILREGILGRELFDFAFKEYARRWVFKRPTPADFFRTMEDASGVDLDWFWNAWFYTNDHVDLSIESVDVYRLDDGHPERSKPLEKAEFDSIPLTPYETFLKELVPVSTKHTHLQDWYYSHDEFQATEKEIEDHEKEIEKLEDWEKEQLEFAELACIVKLKNIGGLPMPMILDISFEDGSERKIRVPAEIWRNGDHLVTVPFLSEKRIASLTLDADNAFADADLENNVFPREIGQGRFKLKTGEKDPNPMRTALFPDEDDKDSDEDEE